MYYVCVCIRERERENEREYGKTGKNTVISKWMLITDPTFKSTLLFPSWTTNQSQSSKGCVIASNRVKPRLLTKIQVFVFSQIGPESLLSQDS